MSKCVMMASVDAVNIYCKLSNKKFIYLYPLFKIQTMIICNWICDYMIFLAGNDPRSKLLKFRHYVMNHNVCAGMHTHRTSHAHYLEILSKDMFAYPYSLTFRS
jgi:hypothetical protein